MREKIGQWYSALIRSLNHRTCVKDNNALLEFGTAAFMCFPLHGQLARLYAGKLRLTLRSHLLFAGRSITVCEQHRQRAFRRPGRLRRFGRDRRRSVGAECADVIATPRLGLCAGVHSIWGEWFWNEIALGVVWSVCPNVLRTSACLCSKRSQRPIVASRLTPAAVVSGS